MRNTPRTGNRVRTTNSNRCARDTRIYGDVRKAKQSRAAAGQKEGNLRISPAAQLKIIKLYFEGISFCEITRRTGHARQTVTKVCRSDDIQAKLAELRGKLIGESDEWVESINFAVRTELKARLAYRLLKDFGIVPNNAAQQPPPHNVWHNNDSQIIARAKVLAEGALRRGSAMAMEREQLEKLASGTPKKVGNLTSLYRQSKGNRYGAVINDFPGT